jgi:outer membrane protein assembly factor BamB
VAYDLAMVARGGCVPWAESEILMKRLAVFLMVWAAGLTVALTSMALPVGTASAAVPAAVTTAGGYTSLPPTRLLDTRYGVGAARVAVAAGDWVLLQVSGRGGVPASGVAAVVLNVTVTAPTKPGFVKVYGQGIAEPGTSNLNFVAGQSVANLVITPVGYSGLVTFVNGSGGTVHLVADVSGYYVGGAPAVAGAFIPVIPSRLLDTRIGTGAPKVAVAAGGTVHLQVAGASDVPASGVAAVVLNVTVTAPTRPGFVTLFGNGTTRPTASTLNFLADQTVPNLVIAPVGADGKVAFYNGSGGTIQLVADVSGYYLTGTPSVSGMLGSLAPTRLLDTRIGVGAPKATVAAGGTTHLQVTGRGAVPASGVSVVVLNLTVTAPTKPGFVTAYGDGTPLPRASNLNFVAAQTVPNLVIAPVGTGGRVNLYNGSSGTIQLVADVVGYVKSASTHASVTTLASSSSKSTYDAALTLTASVTGASGTPTGDVTFTDASNGSVLVVEPLSGGVARLATAALAPGTRSIVASYRGDNVFTPSISTSLVITVAPSQRTVATAFQNNSRHDGMDAGDTFNPATLHKAWSFNFNPTNPGDPNVSYPLIAGGRVFVTVMNFNNNTSNCWSDVYGMDAATGSVDWHDRRSTNSCVWPQLTYDGGQVFVQNNYGNLTAYDAATGHPNWTTAAPPDNNGFASAPTAHNGVLYTEGNGSSGTLYALSEATGELMWSAGADGNIGSPAVDDSGVYGDVDPRCTKASGFDLDGTLRWTNKVSSGCSSGFEATPVLNGGHLYIYGYPASTPAWIVSTATGADSGTFGSARMPAFDAANMYVVRDGANGSVLDAVDKSDYTARWTFTGDATISTTPVTTNGIVFTGSRDGHLYGIDSGTGTQVWTAVTPGAVFTADGFQRLVGLAAADGLLAVPAGGFLTVYTN